MAAYNGRTHNNNHQEPATCIYVANIPLQVRDWIPVRDFFSKFGGVKFVKLLTSKAYGANSKYAFVTFYQQWAMELALNAKPEELMFEGNQLRVEKEDKNHAQKKKIPLTAADIGKLIYGNALLNKAPLKKKWTRCEDEVTGTCYIDMLNDDCMMCIISFLTVQERIIIERVCKAWQRISLDSWSDVKTLSSLNMADGTIISADEYICAMKRATTSLTTIDLTEFFSYDGSVEEDICRIIKNIPHPSSITTLIITEQREAVLTKKLIQTLSDKTPQLKVLDVNSTEVDDTQVLQALNNLNGIEELNINLTKTEGQCLSASNTIKKLKASHLKEEYLHDLYENIEKMDGHLEELTILAPAIGPDDLIQIKCHSLTKLSMEADMGFEVEECVYIDFTGFPNLVELEVLESHYFMRNPVNMKSVSTNCPNLKKLVLTGPPSTSSYYEHEGDVNRQRHLYEPALKYLMKIRSLTYLDISYLPYHYEDGVNEVTKLKSLEQLHMMGMMGDFTSQDMIEIITELPCLKLLNMSDTVREGPKIKINSFIEKLPGDSELSTLEIILGGRKFDLTGVTRWRHGRFIINEEVKSEYRDDTAQSSDDDDPYDPFNQFRMRMAMAEHGIFYDSDDDDDRYMFHMMMKS